MKKSVIHGLLLSLFAQSMYAADTLPEKVTATLPEYHIPTVSYQTPTLETNASTTSRSSVFTAHPYITGTLGVAVALSGMVIIPGVVTYISLPAEDRKSFLNKIFGNFNFAKKQTTHKNDNKTTAHQKNPPTSQSKKITPTFAEAAQSEPWKTELEITSIAEGLETVLKNDLKDQVTEEEIQTLQTETQEEGYFDKRYYPNSQDKTLDHALMRQVSIPADAELYMHADLHGDFGPIQAMLTYLESKNEFDPQTGILRGSAHVAFLGDYIDRGPNSLKNLWYLWQLKLRNPDRVFLIRGNHETATISQLGSIDIFNQLKAGNFDVKQSIPIHKKFLNAFALLPIVTFIDRKGTQNSRIALVHGGINPEDTQSLCNKEGSCSIKTAVSNYLWSDFAPNNEDSKAINGSRGLGLMIFQSDVKQWMKTNEVKIIFHGHDQKERNYYNLNKDYDQTKVKLFGNGKWRGMGSRWEDHAIVLNVAPNTTAYNQRCYNKYPFYCDYGTFACIKPKPENFVPAQPSTDPQFAANTFAQKLTTLPDCILEPIYFLPKYPTTIVPNDQILDSRPQDTFSNNNNLVKQQPNQDRKD